MTEMRQGVDPLLLVVAVYALPPLFVPRLVSHGVAPVPNEMKNTGTLRSRRRRDSAGIAAAVRSRRSRNTNFSGTYQGSP